MDRIELIHEYLLKVPDMNEFLRVACDHQWKLSTQLMHWFSHKALSNLLQLRCRSIHSDLPELDNTVPATRGQEELIIFSE